MKQFQFIATLMLLSALPTTTLLLAEQSQSTDQNLELKVVGNGRILGRRAAFRTYAASDGTEAFVWYGRFKSEHEAKHAINQWLKGYKVTRKGPATDRDSKVIGDRITAAPKQAGEASVVIRKHGLNYWFIQSVSPIVAMQVDGLIE